MTSILDILAVSCSLSPESTCCVLESLDNNREQDFGFLSYSSLLRCVQQHEQWLCQTVDSVLRDHASGDIVVAYISSNSIDMLLSVLACSSSTSPRKLPALLNFRWTPSEISTALKSKSEDSTTIVIYGPGLSSLGTEVASQLEHNSKCFELPNLSNMYMGRKCKNPKRSMQLSGAATPGINSIISVGSSEDALIMFTSGTTGGAKGVRLSHRAISIQSLAKMGKPCGYSNNTTILASTVPLFHIGGLSSCLAGLFAGGTLLFSRTEIGFDLSQVQKSLTNPCTPANTLVVVPAMLSMILNDKESLSEYPDVKLILIGGQSAPPQMIEKLAKRFPNSAIVQTYACTEGASSLTFLPIDTASFKVDCKNRHVNGSDLNGDCVGSAPPHVSLRLYRKSGNTLEIVNLPHQVGIIATQGSHVMNGYWNRGERETNHTGWFLTSDLGYFDEKQQLYFNGRANDVVRSGGETIMCNEVERVLLLHPSILECAIFPREDERFGETVACAIVSDSEPSLSSIRNWCGEQGLASYKRPRFLFVLDALPRNTSGKVLKQNLISMYGKIQRSRL
eukprot:scaffold11634_cov109-Cylindrotheca_fusiformis.AAC.2